MNTKYISNKIRREQTTGERIRTIRKRKHIMVKDLAKMCGVTSKTMQNYEAGERQATLERLDGIACQLGVDPAALYYRFESISDLLHFLFEAEREGLIKPVKCIESPNDKLMPFGIRTSNEILNDALQAWAEERVLLDDGIISEDVYQNWQDAFPSQLSEVSSIETKKDLSATNEAETTESAAAFKQNGYMRLRAHSDHALCGRNGSIVPQNIQNQICLYTNCTLEYLNDETMVNFIPQQNASTYEQKDENTLFEILSIMDKNADTEHYRVIQIQLSRIAIHNLVQKGFDRNAFRIIELVQDSMDYLFTGNKARHNGYYFGFNFSQLDLLRERTGVSLREMFTGE